MIFINEYAKELYEFIIDVNREIMEDKNQKSIHEFKIIGFMSISWTQFFSFFTNIFSQIL